MSFELEKARVMFKLARKNNWNACYDRLEHFKRFQNVDSIIKELTNNHWLIIHKKSKFIGIALNTRFKKEIIEFIEAYITGVKGYIR